MLRSVIVAVFVLALPSWSGGQPPPVPPQGSVRDRVPESRAPATAVVRGRVIDGVTGQPIARARVRIQRPQPGSTRSALSNGEGAFELTGITAGPMNVVVEKSTYLPSYYPDTSRMLRSGMSSRRTLAAGQVVDDVVIRMYRGGSISGRVFDAHGDPVESAQVAVMRVGSGPARAATSTQSNDLGEFRLARLQPGSYLLYVAPQGFRGSEPDLLPTGEPLPQPVPIYYPGVLAAQQAQPITLGRGQAVAGLDLVMHEGSPVLINGLVVRTDGSPISGGFVNAHALQRELSPMFGAGTSIRSDGTFRMTLAPGTYTLLAETFVPSADVPRRLEQQGFAQITIGENATENVVIQAGPGAVVTGRVIFESGSPPAKPTTNVPVPFGNQDMSWCRSLQAQVADDWTFKLEGLMGTCAAPPRLVFGKWTLKSVRHRGEELLHRTIRFEPGQQMSNVELFFTDKRSELSISVSDNRGQPTHEFVAIAFPAHRERWTQRTVPVQTLVPPSKELIEAAKAEGHPLTPGALRESMILTPGDYYVVAIDDVDREEYMTPAFLERLIPSAQRVTIAEGVNQEVDLRLVMREDVIR